MHTSTTTATMAASRPGWLVRFLPCAAARGVSADAAESLFSRELPADDASARNPEDPDDPDDPDARDAAGEPDDPGAPLDVWNRSSAATAGP